MKSRWDNEVQTTEHRIIVHSLVDQILAYHETATEQQDIHLPSTRRCNAPNKVGRNVY